MTDAYFYAQEVTDLQLLLEEVPRAKPGSPQSRFVEPDADSFARLSSRFHHVLYGRRGTGKSSLLRRMEARSREQNHLVAWADQETFSRLSYPDVLVATMAEVFKQFRTQLMQDQEPTKRRLFRKQEFSNVELVARQLEDAVVQLNSLKNSPSESSIEWTASFSDELSQTKTLGFEAGASSKGLSLRGSKARSRTDARKEAGTVAHKYTALKAEHLERAVTTYRELMRAVSAIRPDSYIVLDDFYRLTESVQPDIAGYFHRVVKDTNVWLKFGSIPYWTNLYRGSPATGLQVPHDLREISLDRGLPDFKNSKRFLESILNSLAAEKGVDVAKLFSPGALDRLVLAAGGVPRDYLGLASDSISVAKTRGPSTKSGTNRVGAEDVNSAASRTVNSKFDDLDEDASDKSSELRELVIKLTAHCRNTKAAWFLADTRDIALVENLGRLQNMRFVHLLDANESLPNLGSSRYLVYILDVSQLAAQRAVQVDFMGWTTREKRRSRKLVFNEGAIAAEQMQDLVADVDNVQIVADASDFDDSAAVVGDVDAPQSLVQDLRMS